TDNIALNKIASQQYSFPNTRWGADRAVDGRYSIRRATGGQCTLSGIEKQTATWWVDLGGVLSIYHIAIYYRTDNVPWESADNIFPGRFLGFSVYISNTTDKDEGLLCFKDTNFTRTTIPSDVTVECVNHGRYVIYYNERLPCVTYPVDYSKYAYNELCELEVYGCPTLGFYGENCDLACPRNCQEGHCNIVSGSCLGCVTGYRGSRCEEPCSNSRHGMN
ncbi:uncharacterized protein LOC133189315, partial [Saccostrea echinata]|uniref:uncharacterized protein LOC133189315 n=1 Tax=Saccostrea echinata TaxID=191078 RepID=UPI002A826FFA